VVAWNHDYAIGYWRNVFVCVPKQSNINCPIVLRKELERLARGASAGLGLIVIIEPSATSPPGDERKRFAAINREVAGLKGVAVVFEGSGFKASAVRSVAAAIAFLSRSPIPHKVFSTIEEAVRWMGSVVDDVAPDQTAALAHAIDLIRCDPAQLPDDALVLYTYADQTQT
jgi:hypothetical protein